MGVELECKRKFTNLIFMVFRAARAMLSTVCIVLVAYEMFTCILKYASGPKATNISYRNFSEIPQPVFSFCKEFKMVNCTRQFDMNSFFDEDNFYDPESECTWEDGTMPTYVDPGNEQSLRQDKVALNSTLSELLGWNRTKNDWTTVFDIHHQLKPIKDEVFTIPMSKDEVFFCFPIEIRNLDKYPTLAIKKYHHSQVFLYIHGKQQLSDPTRTNVRFPIMDSVKKIYQVTIKYNKQLSTRENPCTKKSSSYDKCVTEFAVQSMIQKANCSLPFLNINETVCKSSLIGDKAMETYYRAFWNASMRSTQCVPPCEFFEVDIKFQKYDLPLKGLAGTEVHRYNDDNLKYILLSLASRVQVITTSYSYGLVSLIAELGGWLSLFLGFSFPQILGITLSNLKTMTTRLRIASNLIMQKVCLVLTLCCRAIFIFCVLTETFICWQKYQGGPLGTRVHFTAFQKVEKPALSFCLTKTLWVSTKLTERSNISIAHFYYTYVKRNYSESHRLFWSHQTELTQLLAYIDIFDGKHWRKAWGENFTDGNIVFTRMYVPMVENRLQFCYTMRFEMLDRFYVLKFGVKQDVQFAVHKYGQFSNLQYTHQVSALKMLNQQPFYMDTTFNVKLVYTYLGENHLALNMLYDHCIEEISRKASLEKEKCSFPSADLKKRIVNPSYYCNSAESEKVAMEEYVKVYIRNQLEDNKVCPLPQVSIESSLTTVSLKRAPKSMHYIATVELVMPELVKILTSFRTYTLINLVSEVGSWWALFLGTCLLDMSTSCFAWIRHLITKVEATKKALKVAEAKVHILLTTACAGCIVWQLVCCVDKYQAKPLATHISYKKLGPSASQPVFTLCRIYPNRKLFSSFYNREVNMTDKTASALFIDRLLENVKEYDLSNDEWKVIWNMRNMTTKDVFLSPKVSNEASLICQTVELPSRNALRFTFHQNSNLFLHIHNKGQFFESSFSSVIKLGTESNVYRVKMEHIELISTLDFKCSSSPDVLDSCLIQQGMEAMMNKTGCLAPVFHNNTRVCTNISMAMKSMEAYREVLTATYNRAKCLCSCQFTDLSSLLDKSTQSSGSTVYTFVLPTAVKTIESFYFYSFVSFVAEFGGWVGLFLGIYILQLNDLVAYAEHNYRKARGWIIT